MGWLERSSKSLRRKLSIGDSLRTRPNVLPQEGEEPVPNSAPPTATTTPFYNSHSGPSTTRPYHQPLRDADSVTQATGNEPTQYSPIFCTPVPSPTATSHTTPFHPRGNPATVPSSNGPRLPPPDPLRSCPRVVNENEQFASTPTYHTPPARSFSEPFGAKADTTEAAKGLSSAQDKTKKQKALKKMKSIRNLFSKGTTDSSVPALPVSHTRAPQQGEASPLTISSGHGYASEQEPRSAAVSTYSGTLESSEEGQRSRAESNQSYFDRADVPTSFNSMRRRPAGAIRVNTEGSSSIAARPTRELPRSAVGVNTEGNLFNAAITSRELPHSAVPVNTGWNQFNAPAPARQLPRPGVRSNTEGNLAVATSPALELPRSAVSDLTPWSGNYLDTVIPSARISTAFFNPPFIDDENIGIAVSEPQPASSSLSRPVTREYTATTSIMNQTPRGPRAPPMEMPAVLQGPSSPSSPISDYNLEEQSAAVADEHNGPEQHVTADDATVPDQLAVVDSHDHTVHEQPVDIVQQIVDEKIRTHQEAVARLHRVQAENRAALALSRVTSPLSSAGPASPESGGPFFSTDEDGESVEELPVRALHRGHTVQDGDGGERVSSAAAEWSSDDDEY